MRLSVFRQWPWDDQEAARGWVALQAGKCPGCDGLWSHTSNDDLGVTYDVGWEHCNRCAAIQAEQAHQANEAKHRASSGNDGAQIVVKEVWPDG